MLQKCIGEFMDTAMLVLLGDGVVATALLKRSKGEGGGWIAITSGWCFAVMAGIYVANACGSPDAHINPAITLGFGVQTGNFAKLVSYIIAQTAGAFVGAILVWLHFLPHWKETEDKTLKLLCFSTMPAIRSFGANLISETIGTFVLVFVVGAMFSKTVAGVGYTAVSGVTWFPLSFGVLDLLRVERPVMQSITLATSGHALPTRCFQSRAKGPPAGAMRSSQFLDHSLAVV
jgi:glycerol uptake facilitator protein